MLTVLFGLSGAMAFGAADYFGGTAAKFIGALRAAWVGASCGLIGFIVIFALYGGLFSSEAVFWGALSGASGMFAIIFLYASLAIGPMSILSPIGALVAAVVPVVFDFFDGQTLSPLGYVALVIALVAVWFVGFVPDPNAVRPRIRGIVFAVLAGTFVGMFFILIDQAPDDAGIVPLIANRAVQTLALGIAVAVMAIRHRAAQRGRRTHEGPARADMAVGDAGTLNWRRALPYAVSSGFTDAVGNALILAGLVIGNLSVVSVLAALYPGSTILLAALFLHERMARVQYVGLVLALVAAAMLALT